MNLTACIRADRSEVAYDRMVRASRTEDAEAMRAAVEEIDRLADECEAEGCRPRRCLRLV